MELRVSSYGSRAELEAYCERLEPDRKAGLSIVGTAEELTRFQFGPSARVYGIPCRATDKIWNLNPDVPIRQMPTRIKAKGYGLNGQLTELK